MQRTVHSACILKEIGQQMSHERTPSGGPSAAVGARAWRFAKVSEDDALRASGEGTSGIFPA